MTINTLRIASRESPLAMQQALWIKAKLEDFYPKLKVVIIGMTTQGDQLLDSLAKVGGKGLFIKELEQSLLKGSADLAVHSTKDLTVDFPQGLGLAAICKREDARDAIIIGATASSFSSLPSGSLIGTSSLRRQALLKAARPDLQIGLLRGNVNTRLKRLEQGDFAAIVLAVAGLKRLNLANRISEIFDPEEFIPAIGQGALAIECNLENEKLVNLLQVLDHKPTRLCILAERAINQRLQGGCQSPLAGYATLHEGILTVRGLVATVDGKTVLKAIVRGQPEQAEQLGLQVAEALVAQGAEAILKTVINS